MNTESTKIFIDEISMERVILHKLGNKSRDESFNISENEQKLTDDVQEAMLTYFLKGINLEQQYEFNHEHDLSMNHINKVCSSIFSNPKENLYDGSVSILKYLYDKSNNPKIRGGELYVAYFTGCIVNDELVDAIGIFKSETKGTFINHQLDSESEFKISLAEGVDVSKLDKGTIIFNTNREEGYRLANIKLKVSEAKYWNDEFLTITEVRDSSWYTKNYMEMCSKFSKKGFKEDTKDNAVKFLNRNKDFFENYKELDESVYKEVVLGDDFEKRELFDAHKITFQEERDIEDTAETPFTISKKSVKANSNKMFKCDIKLDTDFVLKVGTSDSEEFLERGFDEEREMNYYKVYFNSEK